MSETPRRIKMHKGQDKALRKRTPLETGGAARQRDKNASHKPKLAELPGPTKFTSKRDRKPALPIISNIPRLNRRHRRCRNGADRLAPSGGIPTATVSAAARTGTAVTPTRPATTTVEARLPNPIRTPTHLPVVPSRTWPTRPSTSSSSLSQVSSVHMPAQTNMEPTMNRAITVLRGKGYERRRQKSAFAVQVAHRKALRLQAQVARLNSTAAVREAGEGKAKRKVKRKEKESSSGA
ncbi:hypothetical protein EDC01DRAFT_629210 [Geopyxis carbonaria]|nr:hypothetical protein EDC01DRAFT_629210 [Geopyxis carbonaria]